MFHSGKRTNVQRLTCFRRFLFSPAQSYYDPATYPITLDLQDDSGFLPPDSPATMDQYIAADADLFLGDPLDLQFLSLPLLPVPVSDVSDPVLVGTPSVGELVLVPSVVPLDLSQEGPAPLMWIRLLRGRGTLPGC